MGWGRGGRGGVHEVRGGKAGWRGVVECSGPAWEGGGGGRKGGGWGGGG